MNRKRFRGRLAARRLTAAARDADLRKFEIHVMDELVRLTQSRLDDSECFVTDQLVARKVVVQDDGGNPMVILTQNDRAGQIAVADAAGTSVGSLHFQDGRPRLTLADANGGVHQVGK